MMTFREFEQKFNTENGRYLGIIDDKLYDAWHRYFKENAKVGDGATLCLWTDREAYTIIHRTPKSLTLRRCKPIRKFTPEWIPGGFSAICINNDEQQWDYEENENGRVIKAYWSEKYCRFRNGTCSIIPDRHEYYDYNF